MAEPIEMLVSEAVLYRLESEDVAALLSPKTPEVRPILERYQFLQQRLQDLVKDYALGELNRQQLAQAKNIVELRSTSFNPNSRLYSRVRRSARFR